MCEKHGLDKKGEKKNTSEAANFRAYVKDTMKMKSIERNE